MVTTRSMAVREKMMKRKRLSPLQGHARGGQGARRRETCALERLDNMKWVENERYLVAADNPDTCFIIGVTLVFAQQDMAQGLFLLDKAATAGHKTAAYVLGLLLYKSDEARATGKKYISQVEGDGDEAATTDAGNKRTNQECRRCRKIAEDAVQEVMWKVVRRRGQLLVLPEDNHQCTTIGCGLELGWEGYEGFCSDSCRIKHEYSKFMTHEPL
uniref:At2g35280-like TPR domain-containing protein n=1 Tax=Oryza rufipogon TaxID=4529 RepID=A0A0E0MR78_ORYRU